MTECDDSGGLVLLAALVSRVEALVASSVLEAAGIHVFVGAVHHASAEVNSLALGGHRLMVPATQHRLASGLLREVLGNNEWGFSYGLRRAVLKFLGLWAGIQIGIVTCGVMLGVIGGPILFAIPLAVLGVPVNPQGRGDYFLSAEAD